MSKFVDDMVYLLVGILVLAGIALHDIPDDNRNPRFWKWGFRGVIAMLVLIAGLRYRIGFDTAVAEETLAFRTPSLSEPGLWLFDRQVGGRHALIYAICKSLGLGLLPLQLFCASILNITVGWVIPRYTRNWFLALGFYLCFAFVTLNFEVMLQGTAAAFIVMSIDDLRRGRMKMFWLKFFCAVIVHLSAFAMIWLPLIRLKSVREWFRPGWRPLVILGIVLLCGITLKYILLSYPGSADGNPILSRLGFTSAYIHSYAGEMLYGPAFNFKGILRWLILYVALPLAAAFPLWKKIEKEDFLAVLITLFAFFQFAALFMGVFHRLSHYLIIFACVAAAESLLAISSRRGKAGWWCAATFASVLMLSHYNGSVANLPNSHLYQLYIPYASYLDKGLSHHREWLYHNHILLRDGKPTVAEKDFYYSLNPGSHYIDPPLGDTLALKKHCLEMSNESHR